MLDHIILTVSNVAQAARLRRASRLRIGSVLKNAVGFTDFQWGTFHLSVKSASRTVGSHELRHKHFNG
jgi:hypothetical protein